MSNGARGHVSRVIAVTIPPQRYRLSSTAANIADALRDVVLPRGRSFLSSAETGKTSEAKTDVATIEIAHDLLDALHKH